ncbi:response regulator [Ramlibacter rhizophilus]|uniref:response regulator n=1 Tax=Ramlibacter rhizophilus TaxID=1781167 RepID=UPI00143279EA|nr:response regulator [Ramlibacter rhizophilus]
MTRILVVDDEYDLVQTICAVLELEGYEATSARNGRQALEVLEQVRPDLLLTDVMMPYVSGYDLVEAVRKRPQGKDLPVVIMSAVEPELHPHGAWDEVMQKPFTLDGLLEVVGKLTKGK